MNKKSTVIIAVLILVAVTLTGVAVGIHRYNYAKPQTEDKQTEEKISDNNKDAQGGEDKASDNNGSEGGKNAEDNFSQNASSTEKRPVFIYFVSNDDANYNDAMKVFEELKKEYDGKVDFDLKNVTENPELLDNFQLVKGNTPALIMDGKDGITGLQMKMTDKETLKAEIEKALK